MTTYLIRASRLEPRTGTQPVYQGIVSKAWPDEDVAHTGLHATEREALRAADKLRAGIEGYEAQHPFARPWAEYDAPSLTRFMEDVDAEALR